MTSHSTSTTPYVTIIDSTGQRLDKLQDKIKSIAQMNTVIISKKVAFFHIQDAEYITKSNFSDNICKIVYPGSTVSSCNKKDLINQDIANSNITIFWYSAGSLIRKEEELEQIGFQDPLIIDYVMTTENVEKLTTEDIQAFIIYAMSGQEDKNIQGNIKLLNRTKVLPAISILCQGYISIYAGAREIVNEKLITEALDRMNWDTNIYNSAITTNFLDKEQIVRRTKWWLQIFSGQPDLGSIEKQVEQIELKLKREWNGNASIHVVNLLNALKKQDNIEPDIVANAYIAIADKLNEEYSN
jgi:hypothetical protein